MNDHQLEKKVRQDAAKVYKDVNTLLKDGTAQLSRYEEKASKATSKGTESVIKMVEDGVLHLIKRVNKVTGSAEDRVGDTAASVKKDVIHTLNHFNAKAQDVVNKAPIHLTRKTPHFPWGVMALVTSIGLAAGFILGVLLKPMPQPVDQF